MTWSALLSTLHLFGFALSVSSVFLRGLGLRALKTDPGALARTLQADNVWGLSALLSLSTGLLRAFGAFEKGSGYYLHSGPFVVKLALVGGILALEAWPMTVLIRWRIAQGRGKPVDLSRVGALARVNDAEVALVVAIPFLASAMARGLGFGWFD